MARSQIKKMEEFIEENSREIQSPEKKELKRENLLSTGSGLLNLACSDNIHGAFIPGRYYLIIGSSGAGKTWILMNIAAESLIHEHFKNYKIIYDGPEDGNNVDLSYYFGERTAKAVCPPKLWDDGTPRFSESVEDFYDNIHRELDIAEETGTGIIYMLDSMDALTSAAEVKKTNEQREAREKNRETAGSMGDGKAKVNSANLRRVCSRLSKSGSFLFIICQERDNIGSMVGGKTFSGGNALLFYATLEIWLTRIGDIKATIKGKQRTLGTRTKIAIKKNRLTGQNHRDLELPFYHSFGIDDTGSLVDFLLEEKHWEGGQKETSKISAVEFEQELPKEKLCRYIEENGLLKKLYKLVWTTWKEIKQEIGEKVVRMKRY